MKNKILFFSLLFLFSFSKINCQKDFKIINANYYNWFGGVKGVRGKVFEIQISKLSKEELILKNLVINDVKFQITQSDANGILSINARITEGDHPDVNLNQNMIKNKFFLEYTDKKGKLKKLKIPNFEYKKNNFNKNDKPS